MRKAKEQKEPKTIYVFKEFTGKSVYEDAGRDPTLRPWVPVEWDTRRPGNSQWLRRLSGPLNSWWSSIGSKK